MPPPPTAALLIVNVQFWILAPFASFGSARPPPRPFVTPVARFPEKVLFKMAVLNADP